MLFTVAGMRRTKGLRYAAIRKAQQAKQERDAKRLRRERQVEAALAEFFEHVAVVDVIEAATAAKVAELTAAAAAEVGKERVAAAVALRAMLELGETRTAVSELTGLTLTGVRDLLTAIGAAPGEDTPTSAEGTPADGAAQRGPDPDPVLYGEELAVEPFYPELDLASVPEVGSSYAEPVYATPVYAETADPAAYAAQPGSVSEDVGSAGAQEWARAPDRSGDAWAT